MEEEEDADADDDEEQEPEKKDHENAEAESRQCLNSVACTVSLPSLASMFLDELFVLSLI